jgi:cellulose synthase operon protein C
MRRFFIVVLVGLTVAGCSSAEQRAQNYYQNGQKFLAAHDNARAAIEFKNAVKLKKDMLPAWRGLAQADELERHWTELAPVLRTIIDLAPSDVEARLKLARLVLYGGSADQALELVKDLDDTGNANVAALKATIFFKLNDNPSALREAQIALKIDPKNFEALMVTAADRLKNGDAQGALQLLDSGSVSSVNDLGVQIFKIKIFEQLGDLPQVESLLQKLIELYPKEVAFRQQLVKFYIDQNRQDDAENELRAIIALDPKNSSDVLDLIRFLYTTKGPAAARAELASRISAGGDVFPYQMAMADFDYSQGNTAESFKLLQTLANAPSPDQALAAKIKLAEFNLASKNVDAADALITDILKSDSRNTAALRLRAIILIDRGQLEPAISDLREALNDQPHSSELMQLLATAYERSGAIDLAEKQFADAMKASDYDPNIGLNYVAFLRRRGSGQRAEEVLSDLASRRPNNLAILSALAEVKLERQDWDGAQQIGEAMQHIGRGAAMADQILGAALAGENKYDASISAFQSAVSAAPSAVGPMVLLVSELVRTKQTDRAVAFLQSVLKANPENADALVLLGSVQLAKNAPDQAVQSFTAAIQKQPKDVAAYRALANLYLSQNNEDAALKVIQDGLKQQPDNVILRMTSGSILEQQENYDGAISEYEYILTEQPGYMIAANNLASLLTDHRSDKASLDRAEELAIMLRKSQVPQFKDTLGWISYREGDFNAAVSQLQQATAALPDVALIHYHLGMAYMASGQNAKAADEFKTALTKSPSSDLAEEIKTALKKTATL